MTAKLTDFQPDPKNLNKGTERGSYAIERSLRDYGFARPIVADKDGTILAGNHAFEKAGEIGLQKVRVIETTGDEIIIHKRTDLEADSAKARMVALADNRTTEINLSWDPSEFKELLSDTPEIKNFFAETEVDEILSGSLDLDSAFDEPEGTEQADQELVGEGSGKTGEPVCCPRCGNTFIPS